MIILVLLALVVAVIAALGVGASVRVRRNFRIQNEVVPGITSSAPTSWAGAHSPEALLHRRLRDAVGAAHTAAEVFDAPIDAATDRIDGEAVAIDSQLVAAAALPADHRDAAISRIEPLVTTLEATVAALVERASEATSTPELVERTHDDTDIALEALARARAEVEEIDRRPLDRE